MQATRVHATARDRPTRADRSAVGRSRAVTADPRSGRVGRTSPGSSGSGVVLFEQILPHGDIDVDVDLVFVDGAVAVLVDAGDRRPFDDVRNAVAVHVHCDGRRLLHDV